MFFFHMFFFLKKGFSQWFSLLPRGKKAAAEGGEERRERAVR